MTEQLPNVAAYTPMSAISTFRDHGARAVEIPPDSAGTKRWLVLELAHPSGDDWPKRVEFGFLTLHVAITPEQLEQIALRAGKDKATLGAIKESEVNKHEHQTPFEFWSFDATLEAQRLINEQPDLVARWLLEEHAHSKLNRWHYAAATAALAIAGETEDDNARNMLAAELRAKCAELYRAVGGDNCDLASMNAAWLQQLQQLDPEAAQSAKNGLDAPGSAMPWLRSYESGEVCSKRRLQPPVARVAFARELALALWRTRAQNAPRFTISAVPDDSGFAGLPKVAAGISWALGAPGETIVDGDQYAHEPAIAPNALSSNALLPRSHSIEGLFPGDYLNRPHTALLPLEYDEHEAIFAVAMTAATQYAISPVAGKEALLLLASTVEAGDKPQRIVIGDLARRMNPDVKRLVKSYYVSAARGLEQLRGLFVYFNDYRRVPCFDIWEAPWTPEHATKDMETIARVHPALLRRIGAYDKSQNPFRGYFLINLSGAMGLPTRKPGLLRLYVRTAAGWNAGWKPGTKGKPDPSQIPARMLDEWAALTNSMSPAAVEYLRSKGKSGNRHKASAARRDIRQWFEELEGRNLLRLEKRGRLLQPIWPEAYLHAWDIARMKGLRRDFED